MKIPVAGDFHPHKMPAHRSLECLGKPLDKYLIREPVIDDLRRKRIFFSVTNGNENGLLK